jgi:cytochrome c-type biogenesis protein CcmF
MPWLLAAALLHSAIVTEKRESLKSWTILLAILAFGFSLLGTFLVRSGVITSVHAFANDPERGVFILGILFVFVGGALTLFSFRAGSLEAKGVFSLVSRESALVMNNILLAVSAFVVFVGTLWPLVAEMTTGRTLSVGAPFFNAAFTPFFVALAVILPPGAVLAWKRGSVAKAMKPMWAVLILAVALGGLAFAMQTGNSAMGPIGVILGARLCPTVCAVSAICHVPIGASSRRTLALASRCSQSRRSWLGSRKTSARSPLVNPLPSTNGS